jgi:site-specific recombinase XerD
MTPYKKRSCLITKRLAEDLQIRNMAETTIDAYTYHVRCFADFIQKPLDRVTPEDVRTFQLHLIGDRKLAYSTFNQAVCALRFYYRFTQPMSWPVTMVPFGKRPKTLPVVLSRTEIEKLFQCTPNLKHRTFLMTLYSAGLRFAEAAHLKTSHIDSQRMMIHVAAGKGNKDRYVPLSPRLLKQLRVYWSKYRPPGTLLFPGKARKNMPEKPYADTSIRKAIKDSAKRAEIKKRVYPHVLRHSYATGLLEAGVDLLTISRLLGHASFVTTMRYLHCRREHLHSAPSPLDWLPVQQLPTYTPPPENPKENPPPSSP